MKGPRIELKVTCFDCVYCQSERYQVQSDSGHDVFCTYPSIGKRQVGDTKWDTPDWCPLMPSIVASMRAMLTERAKRHAAADTALAQRAENSTTNESEGECKQ